MKLTKWIALLLMGAMLTTLTACDFGQPIPQEPEKQTIVSEKTTSPSVTTTTAMTTSKKDLLSRCDCGAILNHVTGENLELLLKDTTNLTNAGIINLDSLRVECESFTKNEGIANLFDQTDAQWVCERAETTSGPMDEIVVFFATTEAVTVSTYVLTTSQTPDYEYERLHYTANPIEWCLYGTNDPAVFAAVTPSEESWTVLDYVYDGGMHQEKGVPFGYVVDDNHQASYQFYALVFGYTDGPKLMLSELELYIDE